MTIQREAIYRKVNLAEAREIVQSLLVSQVHYKGQLGHLSQSQLDYLHTIVENIYYSAFQIPVHDRSTALSNLFYVPQDCHGPEFPIIRTLSLEMPLVNLMTYLNCSNPLLRDVARFALRTEDYERRLCKRKWCTFPTLRNFLDTLYREILILYKYAVAARRVSNMHSVIASATAHLGGCSFHNS